MMPGMSGFNDMYKLMQRQTDSLSEVPGTLTELQRAVRGAADTLASSKETVASAQRSTARVEAVVDELEEPVRKLRVSIEKINAILDDPAVERIPATVQLVEDAVVPIALVVARFNRRSAQTAESVRHGARAARSRLRDRAHRLGLRKDGHG